MIRKIGIEGIDGSGKTSVAQEVSRQLGAEGLRAVIFSPFRLANEAIGRDVYHSWKVRSCAAGSITALQKVLRTCETTATEQSADVIIYDRHWMTVMTEISDNPALIEQWGDTFVPTALLQVSPDVATRRADNDQGSAWTNRAAQAQYARKYHQLVKQYPKHILGVYRSEPDVSVEAIAQNIIWDMNISR